MYKRIKINITAGVTSLPTNLSQLLLQRYIRPSGNDRYKGGGGVFCLLLESFPFHQFNYYKIMKAFKFREEQEKTYVYVLKLGERYLALRECLIGKNTK